MKFRQDEIPHPTDVTTARGLRKGEVVFDGHGVPWIVGDVDKNRKHSQTTDNWHVPIKQAIYGLDLGTGRIKESGVVCVATYTQDELIPIYDPADLVAVVEDSARKHASSR